jgi:hypothetical protein
MMPAQVAAASGLAQSLLEMCISHHSATAMDVLKMVSSAAMCCILHLVQPSGSRRQVQPSASRSGAFMQPGPQHGKVCPALTLPAALHAASLFVADQ